MRKWFAPEVVQTSNLDCGPAALTSFLSGFHIPVSYSGLREACHTGLDGTSIDTMETVANQMGLAAEQITIPADHVFVPEAKTLPAIAILKLPTGLTHFVVVWNRVGDYLQVMDPATGRRWVHRRALIRELYQHKMLVPADGWREWAGSGDFQSVLRVRLRAIGISAAETGRLLAEANADSTWRAIAGLDAITRFVHSLADSRAIRRKGDRIRVLIRFSKKPEVIPAQYWTVRPSPPDEDGSEQLLVSGAILVRALKRKTEATPARAGDREKRKRVEIRPSVFGLRLLRQSGQAGIVAALAGIVGAASLTVFEAILFRGLFDLFSRLRLPEQRAGAVAALATFAIGGLALEWANFSSLMRLGRQLEMRLRLAFLEKLPRLSDAYLQSRLTSDMADRAHAAFRLKQFPNAVAQFVTPSIRLVLTTAGLLWCMPGNWLLLLFMLAAAILPPLAGQGVLRERDLKTRTHAGALMRFYLDAMLGLMPIRAHRAAKNLKSEHEYLLGEWAASALDLQRFALITEGIQTVLVLVPVVILFLTQSFESSSAGRLLLTVYWTLNIPLLGRELASQIRRYPYYRNLLARLVEPLESAEEPTQGCEPLTEPPSIEFERVSASISGTVILDEIDLNIRPGEHVAIVGPSGAGKSSLVSVLLGWLHPGSGLVKVNGRPLDPEQIRRSVAWVDPEVQIWNDSLFANVTYGCDQQTAPVAQAVDRAMLRAVLENAPAGLQTRLGEGGGLVSGGEGQRVRFARATLRQNAPLAILDEPFRGLDREKRRELLVRGRQIWRSATLLCVTHDIHQTRSFDRVMVVEGGRISECGKPSTLLADNNSRYSQLMTAERNAWTGLWAAGFWRRIRVEGGSATESTRESVDQPEAEVA